VLISTFQGTKVNIIVGSHVWAEDADIAWVDGEVVKINGEEAEIQATNGKKVSCVEQFCYFL
jgi:myosin-5